MSCWTTLEQNKGLETLPVPSPGDVFLDFEANPYVLDQGLEYLTGVLTMSGDFPADFTYESLWSFNGAEEKKAFERLIADVMERWRPLSGMPTDL